MDVGYGVFQLSAMFNTMVKFLYKRHAHLVFDNLDYFADSLPVYHSKVQALGLGLDSLIAHHQYWNIILANYSNFENGIMEMGD